LFVSSRGEGYGVLNESTKQAREELSRELVVAARRWRTRLDERLRSLGVGEARWAALYWLWRTPGGISQTALAELAGVESPTLVRTLDLLCDAGLVERRVAPHDRRAKLVALTPAAMPLIEQLDDVAGGLRREIMADLNPEEIAVTLRVLRKLRAQLDGGEAVAAVRENPTAANVSAPAPDSAAAIAR
jgi:MarR family transcriptional regulator for hemolysin